MLTKRSERHRTRPVPIRSSGRFDRWWRLGKAGSQRRGSRGQELCPSRARRPARGYGGNSAVHGIYRSCLHEREHYGAGRWSNLSIAWHVLSQFSTDNDEQTSIVESKVVRVFGLSMRYMRKHTNMTLVCDTPWMDPTRFERHYYVCGKSKVLF